MFTPAVGRFLVGGLLFAGAVVAQDDLAKSKAVFVQHLQTLKQEATQAKADVLPRYRKGLDGLRLAAKQNGELEALQALDAEIRRCDAQRGLPAANVATKTPELTKLVATARESLDKAELDCARKVIQLGDQYVKFLDQRLRQAVREDKIELATAFKKEAETVRDTPEYQAAQFLIAELGGADAKTQTPAASPLETDVEPRHADGNTPAIPLTDGLVACWRFDGTGKDSASANHAKLVGPVTFTPSPQGKAMTLTSGSAYARVDSRGICANGWTGITVSVWLKPHFYTTYCNVLTRGAGPPNAGSYGITLTPEGSRPGSFGVAVGKNGTNGFGAQFGSFQRSSKPPPNNWYHLVGTYDGKSVRCYVNGELDGETTLATPGGPIWDRPDFKTYIGTTYEMPERNWSDMYCAGEYDEVRIYRRALAPAEVAKLYRAATK